MIENQRVAYIAGPYRAKTIYETLQNIRRAEAVAVKAWQAGYAVICPHMNSRLLDGVLPDQAFLDGDMTILSRLDPDKDVVVLCPGWTASQGTKDEVARSAKLGLEVKLAEDL